MPVRRPFERSVFINCPFDEAFEPILQAIAFCVVVLGFFPRIAPENNDSSAARLDRIREHIEESKYGIHDISRSRASRKGEYFRMNMPFELGIDYGAKTYGSIEHRTKEILILETVRYDYQKSISDISGWDIRVHAGNFEEGIRHVRDWLITKPHSLLTGTSAIIGKYVTFQEWHWERESHRGASEADIKRYPTSEFIAAMHDWHELGEPVQFIPEE